jgi:hypothetical protein
LVPNQISQDVTVAADDGQPCPEIVEHSRAKRETGLSVIEMRGDSAVSSRQPVAPMLIGNPGIVEDYNRPQQAELVGKLVGAFGHPHSVWDALIGVRCGHKHQTNIRALTVNPRHGSDQ